ncbi:MULTISPECIES: LLM class flavin-dependent oxidoreductase [unclassified Streptomyces]|uniref:LLM class flavin-dependent oxidoreductase n=1 Tax=unclassified Streptomyces TaxID=2593676 RepID=UPI0004BD4E07|nr:MULTISPECIES: LLM class flavin-dependent oxidoreductase [unclassified Streptomyces]
MPATSTARLTLGVRLNGTEERPTGPPHPPAPPDPHAYPFHEFLATELERGRLDALLVPELLHPTGLAGRPGEPAALEATTLVAALAGATDRLGIAVTTTATAAHADTLARRLATLDVLSAGRTGWQPHTPDGCEEPEEDALRCKHTGELIDTLHTLWGAADRGLPAAPPPLPQGRPVLFHTAATPAQRSLAARHADVVLTGRHPLDEARARYGDLKTEAASHGRLPDDLLIWSELTPLVTTRPGRPGSARHDGDVLTGTPAQLADHMEERFERRACDGFVLSFPALPAPLVDFVDQVVPELWRRGLFPNDYASSTLRGNLGLPSRATPTGALHA